jgi:hypothetical protein
MDPRAAMTSPLLDLVHADPWARELIDLPSLNRQASQAIEDAIRSVQTTARENPAGLRGRSIVVLGPAGAGKTHLFVRLRRSLGPRAVFVHVRPLIGSEMTPRYLLRQIVEQLSFETQAFRQLDALVGSLLAYLQGAPIRLPRAFLHELELLSDEERGRRIESAIDMVLAVWPQADEVYLRKVFHTPFAPGSTQRAMLAWLSGREPDDTQLARIGMRDGLQDEMVMPALRTLGAIAAPGAPIVIVFDQLENLVDPEGRSRVRAYGNLVAELVDEVRGVIVVQLALDTEWAAAIEPELAASQKTRAAMVRETLSLPTPDQREELLRLWAGILPGAPSTFPGPFGVDRVRSWCTAPGMTPRMLLIAATRAIEQGPSADQQRPEAADESEQRDAALLGAWNELISRARRTIDDSSAQARCVEAEPLAEAFGVAMRFVPGANVASTRHGQAAQMVLDRGGSQIHLALLTRMHPRSVASALDALQKLSTHVHLVVVRERSHEFPPTWKVCSEKRDVLLQSGACAWIALEREDAARLLALRDLFANARSRDVVDHHGRTLEEDAVRAWARDKLKPESWAPLESIFAPRQAQPPQERPAPKRNPRKDNAGVAITLLASLRVASLDRIVREAIRSDPTQTRASVIASLKEAGAAVRWFGSTLVCMRQEKP